MHWVPGNRSVPGPGRKVLLPVSYAVRRIDTEIMARAKIRWKKLDQCKHRNHVWVDYNRKQTVDGRSMWTEED